LSVADAEVGVELYFGAGIGSAPDGGESGLLGC
jgi:hypothetical protein